MSMFEQDAIMFERGRPIKNVQKLPHFHGFRV